MSLPVTIPFTFGNATTAQSLSSLDTNFTTIKNAVNGLTNGASQINVAAISATGTANSTTYLRGDGAWATLGGGGGGGVTSVDANSTIGFTFTGGPVTSSGTLTLSGPAPGTNGNVLTSNGTAWVSQALSTGSVNSVNGLTGTVQSVVIRGTAVNASGTSILFTSIPSWARRIMVMFKGVSTSGTSAMLIQLGSGSVTSSGYSSTGSGATGGFGTSASTSGFILQPVVNSGAVYHGIITIASTGANVWCSSGVLSQTTVNGNDISGGSVTLSGTIDRLNVTMDNGVDTFASGVINILWE